MTSEHAPEYRHRTLLWLGMGASKTEQSFWAVLSGGQSAKVRAHIAQVATGCKGSPLFCGRILKSVFSIVGVVETTHSLAILFDQLAGIEQIGRASCRERV